MPDTRTSTLSDSVSTLLKGFKDINNRTESIETTLQQHMEELRRNCDEACRNSDQIDRVLKLYESLQGTVQNLIPQPRQDKWPLEDSLPPLLPTPTGSVRSAVGPSHHPINPTHFNEPQGDTTTPPLRLPIPRIEIPIFSGEDVDCWLFQLSRYFEHHRIPCEQWITLATFHMAGDGLKWLQRMYATHQMKDWPAFTRDMSACFGPSAFWNAEVQLNKIYQSTTVGLYIRDFEALLVRTPGLTATNLLHKFMAGLKDEVHREIVLLTPTTLQSAMGMAKVAEKKLQAIKNTISRTLAFTMFHK